MQVIVKTKFEDDIRRFHVKADILLKDICIVICDLYHLQNVRLKYKDEEGDLITITTNNELYEAIILAQQFKPQFLRLEVERCQVELNDSWIVLPNENATSEFPPIFGFQLPVFDDYLENAFQHLSVDEQKLSSEEILISEELIPEKLEEEDIITEQNQQEVKQEIKKEEKEDITPQTRRRIQEMCVELALETKTSCVDLSHETLQDLLPYWRTTVSNCNQYSDEIRQQCLAESDTIMEQTKAIPFSIAEISSAISKETLKFCSEASAGVVKSCALNNITDIADSDPNRSLWTACNLLSSQTSRDCQDLSSKLVAEIMAL